MKQLDVEIAHAGEETTLSPKMLLLEKMRITPEKQLEPMAFLFRLFGKPCFPRRELVAITGKAKSGKTFVTSMLMTCCVKKRVLAFERLVEEDGEHQSSADLKPFRVLWYDTEQSDESTQDILRNRIMKMLATEECPLFDIFNVRSMSWKERRSLLKEAIERYDPDLVIVDGIRDMVNDINDGPLAQSVLERLMHLASDVACGMVCVLHQNHFPPDSCNGRKMAAMPSFWRSRKILETRSMSPTSALYAVETVSQFVVPVTNASVKSNSVYFSRSPFT